MYAINQITTIINGTLFQFSNIETYITSLIIDTRRIENSSNSLFFALVTSSNNGHKFIADALQKGIRNFVVSDKTIINHTATENHPVAANYILVDDTLLALQMLAASHRHQFQYPVIGITGSNGKTIVKEWLYHLLKEHYNIVRSPKSYNSQIGVPLSVWQMKNSHTLALFEAGISQPYEMEKLEHIISPTIGILTNISSAHDENFSSRNVKTVEKLLLFKHSRALIYNSDADMVMQHILPLINKTNKQTLTGFSWSKKQKADLEITAISKQADSTTIQASYQNKNFSIVIPFTDEASIDNAITCWATLLYMQVPHENIKAGMRLLPAVAMRLELKAGINNCSLINDSYNSDMASLGIALDFLMQQQQHNQRTLILSDILQSGQSENDLYEAVSTMVMQKKLHCFIGIGAALTRQKKRFSGNSFFYENTDAFISQHNKQLLTDQTILIKGARTFEFERIVKLLQQKAHQTVLQINLNGILNNFKFYKSLLNPTTKTMCMVKAFAYGSGSFEIANVLQHHHSDYLAVAYADEGVALRQAGIKLPIMVMNPDEQSFDSIVDFELEPEIYSMRLLAAYNQAAQRKSIKARKKHFSVHIKLDTGMHRLGFEMKEITPLVNHLKNWPHIKVASIFSHLAASDAPQHDAFTQNQIDLFSTISNKLITGLGYQPLLHILNSAGVVRWPQAQFNMVRLGIGLHGIGNTDAELALQPVASLHTTISQIKTIAAGETIGYNRSGIALNDMRIATVAIGYADGYLRKLGNGVGRMMIHGKLVPVVGNICMDMCMLDVTGIDCKEGDDVLVFGADYPIQQIAAQLQTIVYEVLCSISQRVKRVYYFE
ncbi:MAG: bifunctional UDP-N-acetylmuramoyl-tripeptide:D-alanyl-D-alanine ligase/alanine racemase [Bacteroidia bacterium]|nr:bifunctional UDP-N-acetylmuramoyl-tripeptide:D-alanyl-D-alanine ligase/alanine racemase [Bacteroidia bacterium]